MSGVRRVLFWAHLATGVSAGLVILVMSVTGTLLAFEVQITAWADREHRAAPPTPDAKRQPIEDLLRAVQSVEPAAAAVFGVTLAADPLAPVAIALGRDRTLLVDPYSAKQLGESSPRARAFFLKVTDWHRCLAMSGDNRPIGKAVTAACNLGFFFLVCSGFYLWWPREWSLRRLRPVMLFEGGLSGRARDFNWHNVIGLWSALPLVLIVGSSVVISYPWASDLVYQLVGDKPPARRPPGGPSGERGAATATLDVAGLDALVAQAERQVAGWQTLSLRLPASADGRVTATIARGGRGRPDLKGQLTMDRGSAAVLAWEPFESYSRGRQLRTWLRWVHTGEAAGVVGQGVAAVASSGSAVLVWTGLALGLRRLSSWRVRRASAPRGVPVRSPLQEISVSPEGGKS